MLQGWQGRGGEGWSLSERATAWHSWGSLFGDVMGNRMRNRQQYTLYSTKHQGSRMSNRQTHPFVLSLTPARLLFSAVSPGMSSCSLYSVCSSVYIEGGGGESPAGGVPLGGAIVLDRIGVEMNCVVWTALRRSFMRRSSRGAEARTDTARYYRRNDGPKSRSTRPE